MVNHADIFMWLAVLLICPFLVGYLLGSIPFGLIFTRLSGLGDIRNIGSGNIGATNVLRTGHKGLAAATLLCDALKGTAAVLLARWGSDMVFGTVAPVYLVLAALGAFLGHLFPVWLKFKGGKGVATFLGCLIGLCFPAALVFGVVWLALAFTLRYSSLAALVASVLAALSTFYFAGADPAVRYIGGGACLMVLLLWWKHKDNIRRLIAGTEGKIGQKG